MAFNDKLKEARLNSGLTQEQLSRRVGVAKSTLAGYEKGNREPSIETVGKIMNCLGIDANFLWQDEMEELNEFKPSATEIRTIKKYRDLDDHGQKTVSYILDRESERVQQLSKAYRGGQSDAVQPIRIMNYYNRLASAGNGEYLFDDIPTDTIEVPLNKMSKRADFVIGVNGNSMEPTYYDGDKVYVEKMQNIKTGDIGIFMVNNECFIKETGEQGLISHNPKYKLIPGSEAIMCIGKVLGKVETER